MTTLMSGDSVVRTSASKDTSLIDEDHASSSASAGMQTDLGKRWLLKRAVIGVLVTSFSGIGITVPLSSPQAQAINDTTVLNFILNLKYLEAEFYSRGVSGVGLSSSNISGSGYANSVSGGSLVPFVTPAVQQLAAEIANEKIDHVRLLRGALGSGAVGEPAIDLVNSFMALGALIGIPNFNPFSSENNFLLGAYIFEDIGITAYRGLIGLISNKQILSVVAALSSTDSYHTSEIRLLLFQLGSNYRNYTTSISSVRSSLSGANDDQGVVVNGAANITPADANGLSFSRTPRQVLNILYGGQNANSGLFFPNGFNGTLK